jgi:hypothetical protein
MPDKQGQQFPYLPGIACHYACHGCMQPASQLALIYNVGMVCCSDVY